MRLTPAPLLATALLAAGPVTAQDSIKNGEWEFVSVTKMPGLQMPELPEGVELPPGIDLSSSGPRITYRMCINKEKLIPQDKAGNEECELGEIKRSGSTVRWTVLCKTPDGNMSGRGTATYSGDMMESEMVMKGTSHGQTIDMTQNTVGRYIGACPNGS